MNRGEERETVAEEKGKIRAEFWREISLKSDQLKSVTDVGGHVGIYSKKLVFCNVDWYGSGLGPTELSGVCAALRESFIPFE